MKDISFDKSVMYSRLHTEYFSWLDESKLVTQSALPLNSWEDIRNVSDLEDKSRSRTVKLPPLLGRMERMHHATFHLSTVWALINELRM